MEMKFEKRVIALDVYGEKFEVSFPTPKQLRWYIDELKKVSEQEGDKSEVDLIVEFLAKLGLPKEKSEEMEVSHISKLVEVLLEVKKN